KYRLLLIAQKQKAIHIKNIHQYRQIDLTSVDCSETKSNTKKYKNTTINAILKTLETRFSHHAERSKTAIATAIVTTDINT
ncbi:MAG: hypothetical protein Q4Q22_08995, partial [Methanosphaera sp.]|nr:hypothetical protein [Methanosphaera sp.]